LPGLGCFAASRADSIAPAVPVNALSSAGKEISSRVQLFIAARRSG
jgi:hypothetical protein